MLIDMEIVGRRRMESSRVWIWVVISFFSFSVFWVLSVSGYVYEFVRDRGGLKRIGIRSSEEGNNGGKTREFLEIPKSVDLCFPEPMTFEYAYQRILTTQNSVSATTKTPKLKTLFL
jgi:hypothetical protein